MNKAKQTREIKKFIMDNFNMKVSMNTDVYSCNISYTLGLDSDVIEHALSCLEGGKFNANEDYYEYLNTHAHLGPLTVETYNYLFIRREIPEKIELMLCQAFWDAINNDDWPRPEVIMDCYNVSNMGMQFMTFVKRQIEAKNFVTQNEEEIKRIWVEYDKGKYKYIMHYELTNGECYTGYDTKARKAAPAKAAKAVKEIAGAGAVDIVEYSAKSIAVIGDTFSIKDTLKGLGGRFNKFLTIEGERRAGWIFPLTALDQLKAQLN